MYKEITREEAKCLIQCGVDLEWRYQSNCQLGEAPWEHLYAFKGLDRVAFKDYETGTDYFRVKVDADD